MLVAAVLVCSLTMTAFAVSLFSSLSGDDLSLSATYEGNGIVTIQVANKSDKDLSFQRQLKLMRWSTGKEVEPVSDTIVFDGTEFEAHTNGVMTVDLSKAYDMDFLEQPLADDICYQRARRIDAEPITRSLWARVIGSFVFGGCQLKPPRYTTTL